MTTEDKYSLKEKQKIYDEYFESDNILKQSLDGMPRYNSKVDNYIIKNNKLIFELLELRGPDLIRLAIARHCDCTCRSFICDFQDIFNLYWMLNEYVNSKIKLD